MELCEEIAPREADHFNISLLKARAYLRLGYPQRAIEILQDCPHAPTSLDDHIGAQTLLGEAHVRLGDVERGDSLLLDAYERSSGAGSLTQAEVTVSLGLARYFSGEHESADDLLASIGSSADVAFARALEYRGWLGFAQGDFNAAVVHFRDALTAMERCKQRDRFTEAQVLQGLTSLCAELLQLGEWATLEPRIRSLDWSADGLVKQRFWTAIYASMMCELVGDDGGARSWSRDAERVSTTAQYRAIAQCRIAAVFRGLGEIGAHDEFVTRAVASYESVDPQTLSSDQKQIPLFIAEELAYAGRNDAARRLLENYHNIVAPTLKRIPGDYRFEALESAVEAAILASSDPKRAVRLYQRAFSIFRDGQHVRRATAIALRLSRLTRLTRYVEFARTSLREVSDRFWMARQLSEITSTEFGSFTETQVEMLKMLLEGRTYKEIARARKRSWKTVNNSVRALCLKLGVNGRAELAAEALRRGIVAVTDDLPDAGN